MQDPKFNHFFIKEQQERIQRRERLIKYSSEERAAFERGLWQKWVQKYREVLEKHPSKDQIRNPRYVLLNYIARQLKEELLEM